MSQTHAMLPAMNGEVCSSAFMDYAQLSDHQLMTVVQSVCDVCCFVVSQID